MDLLCLEGFVFTLSCWTQLYYALLVAGYCAFKVYNSLYGKVVKCGFGGCSVNAA